MLKYLLPLVLLFGCDNYTKKDAAVNIYAACSGPFQLNKPIKGHVYTLSDSIYEIKLEDGPTFYLPVNNCYLITTP